MTVSASLVGLALTQASTLTAIFPIGVRQTAETLNWLICVERVLQYTNLESEGPFETPKGKIFFLIVISCLLRYFYF